VVFATALGHDRAMKLRTLFAAGWLIGAFVGCTSGPGTEAPSVPVGGDGDGDGDGRDQDAASEEHEPPDHAGQDGGTGDAGVRDDAGQDAGDRDPEVPTNDGVHLSIAGEPYETATDIFYFEAGGRPGVQAEFQGGSLRVELSRTLGTLHCSDGPSVTYEVEAGQLRASGELGECTIELEAFGNDAGDPITATVHARVERASGEVADSLRLSARIQVGHP
jgi:hypothetical protein